MQKVSFFRSIHVKLVLIYILLILIALQIIGLYFVRELEQTLKTNFSTSIVDRMNLIEFSVREEMKRERTEDDLTLEENLRVVLSSFTSEDINEIRVIDSKYRILATSVFDHQTMVGQRSVDELVRKSITSESAFKNIYLDPNLRKRVLARAQPITDGKEVIGALYVESNIEKVYKQIDEINQILAAGAAVSLSITLVIGIFIARTITRPISDMREQAQAMAEGNFSRKVNVYGDDEIGQLAIAFNHLTNQLQESQSTTESERRKLSSVLANMTDGVIATDRKGRVSLINDSALKMLRMTRELVLNRPITSVLGLEDYTFEELSQMDESIPLDFSTEERPYILRVTFSVTQRETGFVNGLIAVMHDNTEQEKIDMERREFVSNVSHELRTPLTTMRSYLDALADGAWQDPDIAPNFLNVTQNETERMIRLVNDLLKLSRMDSHEYELNVELVEFNRFFGAIIDRFEFSKSQNVEFERRFPKEQLFVEIDTDKMTQVLDNIISNALKYSPDGGMVRFVLWTENDEMKVSISDEGMGIPQENVGRIFDRFYRADRARSRAMGGTGLGLAIAKEMVVAHGGRIRAESEEGKGTTIILTLPYEESDVEDGEWDE